MPYISLNNNILGRNILCESQRNSQTQGPKDMQDRDSKTRAATGLQRYVTFHRDFQVFPIGPLMQFSLLQTKCSVYFQTYRICWVLLSQSHNLAH